jgi:DNA-binding XRE family transcriptional regulator
MIDKILLKLREEMGISQEMAAKSLNVSRSALDIMKGVSAT